MRAINTTRRTNARSVTTLTKIFHGVLFSFFSATGSGSSSAPRSCCSRRTIASANTRQSTAVATPMVKMWTVLTFSWRRTMSTAAPPAAAPMFMNRYQRLKPALRDRRVVYRWHDAWKIVWMPAMKGAIRTSSPPAIHPRWGSEGVRPTNTIKARSTSDEPIETRSESRMPIQSVITPENVSNRVTAEVKTATV